MIDREKFEKMADSLGFDLDTLFDQTYADSQTRKAWKLWQAALSSRDSTPTEGPVTYHKAEDDTFWIVHNGFCIAHVKNFAPDAPEALEWAQKIVNGLNGQTAQATMPTEGVGNRVVEAFLDEIHEIYINHDRKRCLMIPEADMPKLFSRIDRALAAPRMTLDLRGLQRFNETSGPFWRRLEVLERLQQLPGVEIITDKEGTP